MSTKATKIRVAVIGATGYGGAELLRTLLWHPAVEVLRLVAKDHVGQPIDAVHLNLRDMCALPVEDATPEDVAEDVDVVFLGLPHRVSGQIAVKYADLGVKVIDLSGDMRLLDAEAYAQYYGETHPMPERLGSFAYGMPELNREALKTARMVCSPGCFATAITLGLLPFARAGLLRGRVRVSAMTGSSGSGANPSPTTHHPLRAGTLRPYKALVHQHTPEIEQSLRLAGARELMLDFVPVSAPLVRGILATSFFDVDASVSPDRLRTILAKCWADEPLVRIASGRLPEVAAVAGSMYCDVGVSIDERILDGRRTVVAHSAIDNLVKGGAGQAVQAMNVMLGLDETTGVDRPALWP